MALVSKIEFHLHPESVGTGEPHHHRDVAPERTPTPMGDIRDALGRAHQKLFGKPASKELLETLSAQVSVETAHGAKMYNYNFGGLKGHSQTGETARYMTREVIEGKDIHLRQGFRAYRSLDDGAADYLTCMNIRFSDTIGHAERGDLMGFCHSLKQSGYFTAPESEYASALQSRMGDGHSIAHAPIRPPGGSMQSPYTSFPYGHHSYALPLGLEDNTSFANQVDIERFVDAILASSSRLALPSDKESP